MFFQNVQWRDDLEPVMHQKHVLKNTWSPEKLNVAYEKFQPFQ